MASNQPSLCNVSLFSASWNSPFISVSAFRQDTGKELLLSKATVYARSLKDIIDHFPSCRHVPEVPIAWFPLCPGAGLTLAFANHPSHSLFCAVNH